MLAAEIEQAAKAIYATHWRKPSPDWEEASEAVRDWVRAQALSAINAMRAMGWRVDAGNDGGSDDGHQRPKR